jgi:hypothetical protein
MCDMVLSSDSRLLWSCGGFNHVIDKAAKMVAIVVGIVGCVLAILNYLKTPSPPSGESNKVLEKLQGIWFAGQFGTNDWFAKLVVNGNAYEQTSTNYFEHEGGFSCVTVSRGTLSVDRAIVSTPPPEIDYGPHLHFGPLLDGVGGKPDPEYEGPPPGHYQCPPWTPSASRFKIDSLSASELEITGLDTGPDGQHTTLQFKRSQPTIGLLRRLGRLLEP